MKGSASQPHHNSRREEGKRGAQAGGMPSAGGVRDRSRMAATRHGARGAARRARRRHAGTLFQNRYSSTVTPNTTEDNSSKPSPCAMTTAAKTATTAWAFRTRFRRGAFGWKGTQLAIGRINEALTLSLIHI